MSKLLSIIVPVYNSSKYLKRCVESCFSQGFNSEEFEILLCNDGSIDNSLQIANDLQSKYNCIRVFSQENSGAGIARNLGLDYAYGKYVMFVDSDDYINSIDLRKFIQTAENNNLDVLRFAFKIYDKKGNYTITCESQFDVEHIYSGIDAVLMNYTIGSACGTLFKRDFLIESGIRFRGDMAHEDCEFMLRLIPKAKRLMVTSVCLYTYCWNENSTDRNKSATNIIRLKQSDIVVAKSYHDTADFFPDENPLNEFYHRKGNSLVVQFLISLIGNKSGLSLKNKMELIDFAKSKGVYPMEKFRTLSWKTTLLQIILNQSIIEKTLIRLFN